MITVNSIQITSFVFGQRSITWNIDSTTESLSDYGIEIWRSVTYEPSGLLSTYMELVTTVPATSYDYIDYAVSGLEYDLFRDIFYTVRPTLITSPFTKGDFYTPIVTVYFIPDKYAKAVIRQNHQAFKFTGRPTGILKRRNSGQYCSRYDATLGNHPATRCTECYDVGFTGGYYDIITIKAITATGSSTQEPTQFGEWQQTSAYLLLEPYPTVAAGDVIVDMFNNRWLVTSQNNVLKGYYTVSQRVQIRPIPKDDIIYKLPIDITAMIKTPFPYPYV